MALIRQSKALDRVSAMKSTLHHPPTLVIINNLTNKPILRGELKLALAFRFRAPTRDKRKQMQNSLPEEMEQQIDELTEVTKAKLKGQKSLIVC